ncbi:MAG: ATP-grasp domain-containing protein [Acidobacteriaceae bacterium]
MDCECAAAVESIQSLGRFGAEVHAASGSREALGFASRYVTQKFIQAPVSLFGGWLAELDAQHGYTLIVPATEISLSALERAQVSGALRQKAVLPPPQSLEAALDKEATWQLASTLGLPLPHSVVQHGLSSVPPIEFPLVVKPIRSKRMDKDKVKELQVSVVRNREEWQACAQSQGEHPVQIQEYFEGRGVGVELLFREGEPVWHFAHERLHEYPLTGGGSSYRRAIAMPQDLLEHSVRLLRALEWHGVAMVEWKTNARGEHRLMEVNPRLWGSLALAIDAGVDFPAGLLRIAQHVPLAAQPKYKVGYRTRNIARDFSWQLANWRADHANPLLHTRSRWKSLLELLWPLLGAESWDHFDGRDPSVMARILRQLTATQFSAAMAKASRKMETIAQMRGKSERVLARVQAANSTKVLFLCYGNICRSALAEQLARHAFAGREVASAGFHETAGRRSPENMLEAGSTLGLDLARHRSRRVTQEMVERASLIVIMDFRNFDLLRRQFPTALQKTVFLGMFCAPPQIEITDPFEAPMTQTMEVARQIETAVNNLGARLAAGQAQTKTASPALSR